MSEENFPVLLGAVAIIVLMFSLLFGAGISGFVALENESDFVGKDTRVSEFLKDPIFSILGFIGFLIIAVAIVLIKVLSGDRVYSGPLDSEGF